MTSLVDVSQADELLPLVEYFEKLADTNPNEHPRNLDGMRPFSTGDVKHYAKVLRHRLTAEQAKGAEIERLQARVAEIEAGVREAHEILLGMPELNMSNYTEDEVEALNDGSVRAYVCLDTILNKREGDNATG